MTALTTLVEPLKRELAVPGVFDDAFPDSDDASLAASLADGFSEAQLQGFFSTLTLGAAPDYQTSADISLAGGALVVLFTGMRIIRAQLRSTLVSERYKAGATEYEISRSTNLLRDELKFLQDRLNALIANAQRAQRAQVGVYVGDAYVDRTMRSLWWRDFGGFYPYEFSYAAFDVAVPLWGDWYKG